MLCRNELEELCEKSTAIPSITCCCCLQANQKKLDLLDVLEKKNHHPLIISVFMDAVTLSFEKVSGNYDGL